MARILLELNQAAVRGGQRLPRAEAARAAAAVARALRLKQDARVSVAFVGERDIRRLNAQYRGKDCVTDVLSFPLEGEDAEEEPVLGEILLCYPQARRQAEERGHSARQETMFLLVHGLLHLFGFDHETPKDAARMFPLQTRILEGLGVPARIE